MLEASALPKFHDADEEWRILPWLPDYAVSESGRLQRVNFRNSGRRVKYLTSYAERHGYRAYKVQIDKQQRRVSAHRLVCEAWHGRSPDGKPCVRHLDGSTTNNHYSNLVWGSQAENAKDTVRHGRTTRGEKSHLSKLTWADARSIRRRGYRDFAERRAIAAEYGVSVGTIYYIVKGQTWREGRPHA